jgi:hypothetical protein
MLAPSLGLQAGTGGPTSSVLKTIGMVTGVGPIVTGLLKLFGGDVQAQPVASPEPFLMPSPVSIEAGLGADRAFVPVNYSQYGNARALTPQASAAQIQVNVQAMDSRSFLDHRDEIARAVREAMLNSHSLNDVIAEI